jgi:hypothetical protein
MTQMATRKRTPDEQMGDAREQAAARFQILAAIAAHAAAAGHPTQPQLEAGPVAAAHAPAPGVTGKEQTEAAARRKYRQQTLGIQDLRQATADQLAAAHGDHHALLNRDDIAARREALAYSQVHGGTGRQQAAGQAVDSPGKTGPTVIGGRPVVTAGNGQPVLAQPRKKIKRSPVRQALA